MIVRTGLQSLNGSICAIGFTFCMTASVLAQAPTPPAATRDAASIAGTPDGTIIPVEYARTLGQFIYVWSYPMANTWPCGGDAESS